MTLLQLGICAGSIYTTFLIWGLLQERLTKTPYISPATLLHPNPQPDYFRSPLFLNTVQALFSSIVACIYLLVRNRGSIKPVSHILGLHTLTPDGIPAEKQQNGSASNGTAAPTRSRWISPLLSRYILIAALQSTASQLGFLSLRYISYPTLTLAKSCKLVPVLVMNVVLYRRKFAVYKYAVVGLVTLGIWLFMAFAPAKPGKKTKGPESSSVIGLLLCLLNLVLDGATNSTQDQVFSKFGRKTVSAGQMMLVMNAISALLMALALSLPLPLLSTPGQPTQLSTALAFTHKHPQVWRDIIAYALAGAVGQVSIFETLERFGSLTLVSITVTRKLFTMLLSVVVYKHELSSLQWVGVAVVFAGIGIEAREKRREGLAKKVVNDEKRALAKDA
ncbi:related to HUT1-involved in UDP-galactose transport to the Golgi lumen [Sporisorium reilianum f. sp. reilianum]|uniref:UDP-galactose transporter homolog 1 n=1 Tax=Sporisorium reilianum f. sp. reilianum TaxID=72559 RepID=A0A2N8UEJ4_9BASI|nr:related to HUT1-involved in UDP-galactose transport to the Golgi lumen [Sporisorium reilianum f. sp. reilianum]